jgi:hypothetical protein
MLDCHSTNIIVIYEFKVPLRLPYTYKVNVLAIVLNMSLLHFSIPVLGTLTHPRTSALYLPLFHPPHCAPQFLNGVLFVELEGSVGGSVISRAGGSIISRAGGFAITRAGSFTISQTSGYAISPTRGSAISRMGVSVFPAHISSKPRNALLSKTPTSGCSFIISSLAAARSRMRRPI